LENKDIVKKTCYGLFNFQTISNLKERKIKKIVKDNQSERNKEESGKEIILLNSFILIVLLYIIIFNIFKIFRIRIRIKKIGKN
jgi:hypothetical protein